MTHQGISRSLETDWRATALAAQRGWILTLSIVAIVLGVFILFNPDAGLATIAVVFGVFLLTSGVARASFAIADPTKSMTSRWIGGIVGLLVAVAGVACLVNLFESVQILGLTLGLALLLSGLAELFNADRAEEVARPTWLRVISGIFSVLAGIIAFIVPFVAIGLITIIGAVALIVTGIGILFLLPKSSGVN